MGAKKTPF